MRVEVARGLAGATGARGTVVVIDVLRAFTTAAFALAAGADSIELVGTPEEAFERRRELPEALLVGEVGGRPIPGFDHGNSPEAMRSLDLSGHRVVLRSSSGVQGALRALPTCAHLLLGSFVTAAATERLARSFGSDVTLVAMGAGNGIGPDGPEDDACAEWLAARLVERPIDLAPLLAQARASPAARLAYDPTVDWISPEDVELALALDRFDFALRAASEEERLVARAVQP